MEYPKTLPTWAYIVLAVIVGGGLGNFFPYFKLSKEVEKDQVIYLQSELRETKNELKEVTKELIFIKEKLIQITATTKEIPYPNWIIDAKGNIVFASDSYEREFLSPNGFTKEDFKSVEDIFGAEIASKFSKWSKLVIKDGNHKAFVIPITSAISGEAENWVIQKWPWKIGNEIIGVNGVAIKIPK